MRPSRPAAAAAGPAAGAAPVPGPGAACARRGCRAAPLYRAYDPAQRFLGLVEPGPAGRPAGAAAVRAGRRHDCSRIKDLSRTGPCGYNARLTQGEYQGFEVTHRWHCPPSASLRSSATSSAAPTDTGSPEVQIALLSARINETGRALHRAQARPLLASRAAQARHAAPQAARLPEGQRPGSLPGRRRQARPAPLTDCTASGPLCGPDSFSPLVGPSNTLGTHPIVNVHKTSFQYGPHTVTIETGRLARQADGAVLVSMGDTVVLVTAVGRTRSAAGQGFLPADRQLHREDLRRGSHPGRLLQARRPPLREGDADLAPDRPSDPPAVPRGLLQRSAGRRDGRLARSGNRLRHPRDARRLGGAGAVGHPVQGPDRRCARRLQRRQVPAEPVAPRT